MSVLNMVVVGSSDNLFITRQRQRHELLATTGHPSSPAKCNYKTENIPFKFSAVVQCMYLVVQASPKLTIGVAAS